MPAIAAWRRSIVAIPALVVTALGLSLTPAPSAHASTESIAVAPMAYTQAGIQNRNEDVQYGVRVARNQKGDPYVYGAAGPNAFDCSGLTSFAYGRAGLYLPRSSGAQASYVRHIHRTNMHRGDLMFFSGSGGVYHVGIYMGWSDGRRMILHSSRPGTPVRTEKVWSNSWFPGTLRLRNA